MVARINSLFMQQDRINLCKNSWDKKSKEEIVTADIMGKFQV